MLFSASKWGVFNKLYLEIRTSFPGILTGSLYKDPALNKHGFSAEGVANESVIVVKSHEYGWRHMEHMKWQVKRINISISYPTI